MEHEKLVPFEKQPEKPVRTLETPTWRNADRRQERIDYLLQRQAITTSQALMYKDFGATDLEIDTESLVKYHEAKEREQDDARHLRNLPPVDERGIPLPEKRKQLADEDEKAA